ncbi:MAG: adenylate/guanylate cyclase domain-containing protein [Candidatus Omnitrophica bacterium]|nr:adenylate/guanylate cyclase domain-containing protein [Candidatus Omnitrophota bacterium]
MNWSSSFSRISNAAARAIPAAVFVLAVGLRVLNPPALDEIRARIFDAFQRMHPRAYQPVPVRIIDVDDETLTRLGQWPWPRTQVAALVDRLTALGAAPIAFDAVFAEPDRTSPSRLLPQWSSKEASPLLRAEIARLPDHDRVLAQAIARAQVVTGFTLTSDPTPSARPPAAKAGFAFAGEDPVAFVASYQGAVVNLPALEAAAAGNGHFTMTPEPDGMTRRVPLVLRFGDALYPSLVLEALRVYQGASSYGIKSSGGSGERSLGARTGIVSLKVGSLVVPTDAQGRAWVYYTEEVPARTIPAWKIFSEEFPADALTSCIVFVGTSAAGLKDLRATPLNPSAAGVSVHAQLAEQMLTRQWLQRPDWADGAEICFLIALGLALMLLLPRAGALWCAGLGAGAIGLAIAGSWYAFLRHGLLLDPVVPSLAALGIYLVASLMGFMRAEAERRQVRRAFGMYLSPVLVERLAQHPEQLKLGGERKIMTVLFLDIRGFTGLAEQQTAEEITRFINQFLTPMTREVMAQDGTIDKYVGDCLMAFWNAPLDDPQHARHACLAALGMRQQLVRFNQQLAEEHAKRGQAFDTVHIGIGVNTGECVVGNLGSEQRFNYSVLGDSVNLASRLEGQSKEYRLDMILGEGTQTAVPMMATVELDLIRVKGRQAPTRIFGLIGDETFARDEGFRALLPRHQQMLSAYRAQRWEEAAAAIHECLAFDTPRTRLRVFYQRYLERIDRYQTSPPPADWDGVFASASK